MISTSALWFAILKQPVVVRPTFARRRFQLIEIQGASVIRFSAGIAQFLIAASETEIETGQCGHVSRDQTHFWNDRRPDLRGWRSGRQI